MNVLFEFLNSNFGLLLSGAVISDGLDLKDKKKNEFHKARWLNYVLWWDSRATAARRRYSALPSAVVIAGALIPALVGLRELNVWGGQSWLF